LRKVPCQREHTRSSLLEGLIAFAGREVCKEGRSD
jgi:hypothetical protein